jgi:tetratricopeptide (TPR) repeat protein
MLKRATSLAHKGRLVEAVRWYRDFLGFRPLSVAGYDGLGRAYFRMGLTEEANREFTIADSLERILHNRDDIEAAGSRAIAFLDRKQAKMSVSLIEPVLVAHFYTPTNSDLLKAMGRVYGELRAHKKMYQVYAAGLLQYPNDYEFHILKGNAEVKRGNPAEAERLIRWGRLMKKLQDNPKDPNAKMSMGELCIKEQKTDEGLKMLREAAVLLPENTGIRWRLFNLYQKQGKFPESLKYFLEIVALEPENEDLKYRLADFYRKNKHKNQALDIYRELAELHPREPKPHAMLGDLLAEQGEFEEGQKMKDLAQTLEYGLKPNPDHRETIHFMKYLNSIGQYSEAREWLDRGLTKWPYHGELVLTKVKLLYNEYHYQEAVQLLKRLISVKPDVAEPHIWIAMCYQRLGDNMAALAEAQLCTRLAPKSYTAHKVLGDIFKEQKKLSQANAAYEVAEMMRQSTAAGKK